MFEQGRFRSDEYSPLKRRGNQHCIDERVGMVRNNEDWPVGRHMLATLDDHVTVVPMQRDASRRPQRPIQHPAG